MIALGLGQALGQGRIKVSAESQASHFVDGGAAGSPGC